MDKQPPERRRLSVSPFTRPTTLLLMLYAAAQVWAQDVTPDAPPALPRATPAEALPVVIVPRVSVAETFTDNVNLVTTGRRSDQITEIAPGIRISHDTGRVRGYFDYALRGVSYAQHSNTDNYLNALSSVVQADVLNDWLFVDFNGSISQQSISGFGTLSGLNGYANPNSAEFSSYRLSPYVRGNLAGVADYEARVSRSITQSNSALANDVGESQSSVYLSGSTVLSRVGWVADASRSNVDYSAGRGTEVDQLDVGISLAFTSQLSGVLKVGRENSNYTSINKKAFNTADASLSWKPSPQMLASASWGQRSFGNTHALNVEYSTPLVSLRFADRRDVAAVPGQVLPLLLIPVQGPPVIAGFATTALTVQNRQDLVLTLLGVRDTVSLGLSQSEYSRLDELTDSGYDLARSTLRQSGVSVGYNHKLTPRYQFGVQLAAQQSNGAPGREDNLWRTVNVNLIGELWRNGRGSVGVRRSVYTGAAPYDETALTVGLTVEF